jgi:arabinogalactan oligomer/maltooligosaccharide transport system permease protein
VFRNTGRTAYAYVTPALLLVALLSLVPNVYSLYLAFTNYSIYHFDSYDLVGLKNFYRIFSGRELQVFMLVFGWTLVWSVVGVAGSVLVGLVLALVLNQPNLGGRNLYRTLFIVPWAIPAFISVMMWQGLFNTKYGSINLMLRGLGGMLGLHLFDIDWLHQMGPARAAVLIVNVWLAFPFMMTVILGALQSISADLYEAASVDGASRVRQFFAITIPQLRSAMLPVIISSFAFNFNQFGGIYLLTGGGPPLPNGVSAGATDILVTHAYHLAFVQFLFGTACAYAVLIFIVVAGLSLVNFNLAGVFEEV